MSGAADDAAEAAGGDGLVPAVVPLLAPRAGQVLEGLPQEGRDLQQHQARQHLQGVGAVRAARVDGVWGKRKHTHTHTVQCLIVC